ncbi:MAG: hypothetical protein HYV63_02835 [Candidatus Schekmanbacteria bacterium]|nr:hypothetical protein [Candidatus Schekmanbacteria bacterium]
MRVKQSEPQEADSPAAPTALPRTPPSLPTPAPASRAQRRTLALLILLLGFSTAACTIRPFPYTHKRLARAISGLDVLAADRHTVYAGGELGLVAWPRRGKELVHLLPWEAVGRINDLAVSADGAAWVATNFGVYVVHRDRPADVRRILPGADAASQYALAVLPEADGSALVGTAGGLYSVAPPTAAAGASLSGERTLPPEALARYPALRTWIRAVRRGPRASIWIGTEDGAYLYRPTAPGAFRLRHYGKELDLGSAFVDRIAADNRGGAWLGFPGGLTYVRGTLGLRVPEVKSSIVRLQETGGRRAWYLSDAGLFAATLDGRQIAVDRVLPVRGAIELWLRTRPRAFALTEDDALVFCSRFGAALIPNAELLRRLTASGSATTRELLELIHQSELYTSPELQAAHRRFRGEIGTEDLAEVIRCLRQPLTTGVIAFVVALLLRRPVQTTGRFYWRVARGGARWTGLVRAGLLGLPKRLYMALRERRRLKREVRATAQELKELEKLVAELRALQWTIDERRSELERVMLVLGTVKQAAD